MSLLEHLARLDARIAAAVVATETATGRLPESDPLRGLYVDGADVTALLGRGPLGPPFLLPRAEPLVREADGRFDRLRRAFDLDAFDVDAVLIALAPDVDVRYERLFGFLQDDVAKRRATADLVVTLLAESRDDRLRLLARLDAAGILRREGIATCDDERAPLTSVALRVDAALARYLRGDALAACLVGLEVVEEPSAADDDPTAAACAAAALAPPPVRLSFGGADGPARRRAAEAAAAALGRQLVVYGGADVGAADRLARVADAVLYLPGGPADARLGCDVAIVGASARTAATFVFPEPDLRARRRAWRRELDAAGIRLDAADVDALAARFRLTEPAIAVAVRAAAAMPAPPTREACFAAARRHAAGSLDDLATRVVPNRGWDDLVLPEPQLEQLRELVAAVAVRPQLLEEWGFGARLGGGRGVSALFAGPSGTGKTLAAEVVAAELGLDLYRVELAGVVSKYIGETEKNLDRVFTAADGAAAVLLFDEADALFGKRSDVRDAHDRYANIEVSYLLQKMEQYDGVAILTTNLRENLDDAFLRRLSFVVRFPLPDLAARERLWDAVWPEGAPRGDDVDVAALAAAYRLSGAGIRNVVLAAAGHAAAAGDAIGSQHLLQATIREYEKAGKALAEVARAGAA